MPAKPRFKKRPVPAPIETPTGSLRVWWIPQVPGQPFRVPVADISQAKFLLTTLANYDLFQFEQRIKGDYANIGGLEVFEDGEWFEWNNEDGEDSVAMGVEHSAFVAYGAKVTLKDDASIDDLDQWMSKTGKEFGLGYVEWGALSYGGDGGFVVGDRRFMRTHDFGDAGVGSLSVTSPPTDTESRLAQAMERGAPFRLDGDGVRWWVGGCTW
jgi:hypothetical protein